MKCTNFRFQMMLKRLPERTRAERALFARHGNQCVECWNWMLEMSKQKATADILAYPVKMLQEDNKDEEFVRVFNSPEVE